MRVLFLTEHDPLDMTYGGGQRTHFIWEALCQVSNVVETVLPVSREAFESYDATNHIRRMCLTKRYSLRWFMSRLCLFMFKRFRFPGVESLNRINDFYQEPFDVIVVRYPGVASRYAAWKVAPLVIDVDDVPTQSFETNWIGSRGVKFRVCYVMLKKWQEFVFKKATMLWVANPENKMMMPSNVKVSTLPNIPRKDHPSYSEYVSPDYYVFYLGCLAGQAEDVGIDYVLNHYWPNIHARYPNLTFKIGGSHLPETYKRKWSSFPNVEVLGFVDDLNGLYRNARAMLAPIYAGAGTAIKVRECLTYGRVCIGSPFAWRGSHVKSSAAICYENEEQLMAAISKIFDDEWLLAAQKDGVRAAEANFSMDDFCHAVRKTLESVVNDDNARPSVAT